MRFRKLGVCLLMIGTIALLVGYPMLPKAVENPYQKKTLDHFHLQWLLPGDPGHQESIRYLTHRSGL